IPGLSRLEYRGYDSAGIAVHGGDTMTVVKRAGRMSELEAAVAGLDVNGGRGGVGHTRWATHGAPNTTNAHPHQDCAASVVVVHNGIIENWAALKSELVARGHSFASDTDTEVVAHMIEEMADLPLAEAVRQVMKRADGALALVVMRVQAHSPLVVGRGDGENFIASDIPAFLEHTRDMVVLDDDRVIEVRPESVTITDLDGNPVEVRERKIEWDFEAAAKGGYPTFMLKEIHEQPDAIADTLLGRVDASGQVQLKELELDDRLLRAVDKVFVVACGTSYHAAMM